MLSALTVDMKLSSLIDNFNQLEDTLKDFLLDQSKSLLKIQKEKSNKVPVTFQEYEPLKAEKRIRSC